MKQQTTIVGEQRVHEDLADEESQVASQELPVRNNDEDDDSTMELFESTVTNMEAFENTVVDFDAEIGKASANGNDPAWRVLERRREERELRSILDDELLF